jgi:hypothetical protein
MNQPLFKTESAQKKEKTPEEKARIAEHMKKMREASLAKRRENAMAKKGTKAAPAPAPVTTHAPTPASASTPTHTPTHTPAPTPAPPKTDRFNERLKEVEAQFKTMAGTYIQSYLDQHKKQYDEYIGKIKEARAAPKVQTDNVRVEYEKTTSAPSNPPPAPFRFPRFSTKESKF